MPLTLGTRLGSYEVTAKLGAGGMGEVYRATDTRLKREVAVKVLPAALAADPERLGRLQREAEVLASLNHPNVATIYGLEDADHTKALVIELVDGDDLSQRIAQGPIPLDEALPIARQIAEALEAAHEQGIVHRDLKPANVKVKADGTVKVLDFGLAKVLEPAGAATSSASMSPTLTTPAMSQAGMILGTAAYMSPEQARGRAVDKRADIWAFGCVFYEMLTGARAFAGEDVTDVLAAVVRSEPAWDALPEAVSPTLRVFLRRCLHKDPKQRVADIRDVRLALEGAFESGSPTAESTVVVRRAVWRRALPVAVALVAGALLAWGLMMRPVSRPPANVERFVVTPPGADPFQFRGPIQNVAISPDGTRIVYVARADGAEHLDVRTVGQLEGSRLFSGPLVANPVISRDGSWIGFATTADSTWKRVSILGGPALTLFPTDGAPRGASWGPDDTIIFAHANTGLFEGAVGGGDPRVLTTPDVGRGETGHAWPEVLPGGGAVLFTVEHDAGVEGMELAVLDLVTMERKVLLAGGRHARYVATGHLVYGAEGTLRAVPFDLDRLLVTGDPVPVLDGVTFDDAGVEQFSLSADGSLVYAAGGGSPSQARTLVWVDRQGREEPVPAPPRTFMYPRLSPDGTKVALDIRDQDDDIWVWDVTRATLTRLTFDPGMDRAPVWSPDGLRIAFSSQRGGIEGLFWQAADGTGAVERLWESTNTQFPTSFSPDGTRLVFTEIKPLGSGRNIAVLDLADGRETTPLVQTTFTERNGEISPDGRWLAYESEESGQLEIYVRTFPDVDAGRWQVSTGGGIQPLWARSGEELFYLALDGALMRVAVEGEMTFRADTPARLFQGFAPSAGSLYRTYDVSPDGQRFLMIKEGTPGDGGAAPSLILVRNWVEELKRLVPTH
jgi:Tol biopolymer transport system component